MPWIVSVARRAMIVHMRLVAVALALVLTLGSTSVRAQAPRVYEPEQSRPWAVYFSPGGGAAQAVVEAIGRAGHTVLVQASSLSSPQITKSLADAQQRGVKVEADRESAENLLIIHAPTLAARYGENWQAHAAHSVRYTSTTP